MSRGPGKWQKVLIDALEEKGAVPVTWHFNDLYERSLEPAEYSAIHRAADQLVKNGAAEWHQVWSRNHNGRRSLTKWIFRKGTTPKDYDLPEGKGALNLRRGERLPA